MPNEWFIHKDNQTQGPFSDQQVKKLAELGQITPATRIRLGAGTWSTASSVKGLFPSLPTETQHSVDNQRFEDLADNLARNGEEGPHGRRSAAMSRSATKTCPFCAEEIKSSAVKCKHCGEFLGEQSTHQPLNETETAPAPHTGPRRISGLDHPPPLASESNPITVGCSSKYLRVRCVLELAIVGWIATVCIWCLQGSFAWRWVHWAIGLVLFLILGALVLLRIKCLSMYRFTFGTGEIRTRKNFTNHRNVTTPAHQIQSVSAHEGVLEALLGVGTIEISTASSRDEDAVYIWPHIQDARRVAEKMRAALASKE